MNQVQLSDHLYKEAQRRAMEAGYASVDEYVADVLSHDFAGGNGQETPDLDRLFYPRTVGEDRCGGGGNYGREALHG